jgi:hypothetical protein
MSRLLPLLALLALAAPARAQSAVEYYHEAARHYIGGEREAAEQAAERGLRLAPADPRLRALLDRIRQQQEPSGQGGQQQDQQPSPGQQSGEQDQQGNESEQEDQQQDQGQGERGEEPPEEEREGAPPDRPPEEQPRPEPGDQPRDQGREDAQPRPDAPRPGEGGATPESAVPVEPGEMTQAEAERILNAVGAEERLLLRRIQQRPGAGRRVEKDW